MPIYTSDTESVLQVLREYLKHLYGKQYYITSSSAYVGVWVTTSPTSLFSASLLNNLDPSMTPNPDTIKTNGFPLEVVTWADYDGDQYVGVRFGRFAVSQTIKGEGIFAAQIEKSETRSFDCILYDRQIQRSPSALKAVAEAKEDRTLECFLRETVHAQIVLFSLRLISAINSSSDRIRIFPSDREYIKVEPFEPVEHLQHSNEIIKAFASFIHAHQVIHELTEAYKDKTLEELRNDSRLLKTVTILGGKKEAGLELMFSLMKTPAELSSTYIKVLGFYL